MSNIGYFTFAQNSKIDYVKLAYVCALSLKISQPNINKMSVAVTPKTKITEKQKLIFDQIVEIPWHDDAKDADWKLQNEWKALHISPYDSTLKIDSDMFFNSNIEHWFKELQFYPYTDHKFISSFIGKNAKKKLEENKKMRKQLIEEIGNYILNFLPEEDIKFIIQLNTIINQK
jgi:hypothetical protein